MNPLGEELPRSIRLGGEIYPVRWDWRSCMRIILAMEDQQLTQWEKLGILLEQMYEKPPPGCREAVEKAVKFLNCGEETAQDGRGGESGDGARLYSFEKDARLIYSAFRQSHGIDLAVTRLHWWEFSWLFMDLREDCTFCRVVSLRDRKRRGLLTPEERRRTSEMEELLELPGKGRSLQEQKKLDGFMKAFGE